VDCGRGRNSRRVVRRTAIQITSISEQSLPEFTPPSL